jgi:hypothetical protein
MRFNFSPVTLQPHSESIRLANIHINHLKQRLAEQNISQYSICITAAEKRGINLNNYENVTVFWEAVYEMEKVNKKPTGNSKYKGASIDCIYSN